MFCIATENSGSVVMWQQSGWGSWGDFRYEKKTWAATQQN
jgi:hypothetical protein